MEGSNTHTQWFDNIYSAIAICVDKISNLSTEILSSLLNRMNSDSMNMSKSPVFSKLLLNILNKCRNYFVINHEVVTKSPFKSKTNENFFNNGNDSFMQDFVHQASQIKNKNQSKPSEMQTRNTHMLNIVEVIIENNKTLMKSTLANILKSYKIH
jgi:hypothetical protein